MAPAKQIVEPAPIVIPSSCPSGTTDQGNGTCLAPAKQIVEPAPVVISASCPAGTTDLGNGTCQEPAKTVFGSAPVVIPQPCPAGTTDLGDGTCQEPAKTVIGSAPIVVNQPCPSGTIDLGNGTCEAPARVVEQAPVYVQPAPVTATCPVGTVFDGTNCIIEETIQQAPQPSGTFCYGDGNTVYDEFGRKIKNHSHQGFSCDSRH